MLLPWAGGVGPVFAAPCLCTAARLYRMMEASWYGMEGVGAVGGGASEGGGKQKNEKTKKKRQARVKTGAAAPLPCTIYICT